MVDVVFHYSYESTYGNEIVQTFFEKFLFKQNYLKKKKRSNILSDSLDNRTLITSCFFFF